MKRITNRPILIAVAISLAALYAMMGMIGAAPVQAFDPMGSGIEIMIFDDDHVSTPTGNQGTHDGSLTCEQNDQSCQGVVDVALDYLPSAQGRLDIEYRFRSMVDFNPDRPRRMVVTGDGDINDGSVIEQFTFSLTAEDSGDGRLSLNYQASNPKATLQLDVPDTWVSSQ